MAAQKRNGDLGFADSPGKTANKKFDIDQFTVSDLLHCFADILDELKKRGVVRTLNNPVGDYAEWLVSKKFEMILEHNSKSGYDATSRNSERFQIKSRRIGPSSKSRQLSVIRNLDAEEFDYLIGIIFERDFTVKEAYKIPHSIISIYAKFSKHQNGHILYLRGDILNNRKVEDITTMLRDEI